MTRSGLFITLLLFFICSSSVPQVQNEPNADTAEANELKNTSGIERLKALLSLAEQNISAHPENTVNYATDAIELARVLRQQSSEVRGLFLLGKANYNLHNYKKALDDCKQVLDVDKSEKNDSLISGALYFAGLSSFSLGDYGTANDYFLRSVKIEERLHHENKLTERYRRIGSAYHESGDLKSALIYYTKALEIEKQFKHKKEIAEIDNYIGIAFYDLGSYEKALEYYLVSLNLMEELVNKEGVAQTLNNIGIVYYDIGKLEKALEYYQKSLQTDEELGHRTGVADSYNNIGIIYSDWKQYDIAIDYYNKANDIYKEYGRESGLAKATNNIGEAYFAMGNSDEALKYLVRSLKIEEKLGNKLGIAQSCYTIGDVYFQLKNYDLALQYNTRSFKHADSLQFSSVLMNNYELFYKIYSARKDYLSALDYYRLFSLQKDTVYSRDLRNDLVELQAKFEMERLNKENELVLGHYQNSRKEVRMQQRYLIIIFILMLVFGILVFFDIRSKIKANKRLQSINTDISSQKESLSTAMEELGRSEIKYKTLVEFSPIGIIYIDPKGNILEANRKILDILGSPSEDATKKINCLEYPPLKEVGLSAEIETCLKTGKRIFNENSYTTKWGKQVYLRYYITPVEDKKGTITRLILSVEDITSSKIAEELRKESEAKYRMLVENSLQAMFIIQGGKIIFTNPRFEELTQFSGEEIQKKGRAWLRTLVHPDDYKQAVQEINNLLNGGDLALKTEYRYFKKDGSMAWVETLATVVDFRGRPAIFIVGIDITERKHAEAVLIKSGAELKNLNATKDKFFSIVAHDLKNPFNAILGLSNLLYEAYDDLDDSQRKDIVKNIVQSSENTFKLLQNLLEWSRTQTGKIEYAPDTIDIHPLVEENILIFSSAAENKNIEIRSIVPAKTMVYADENMIKTVIRNLISNAIKFTEPSGEVEISAITNNSQVEISVSDTGIGIKPEDIARLFRIDEQFTTAGTFGEEGSGLGLILCKELIEKNQGKVWAESEIKSGTKFKFTLPVSPSG